MRLAQLARASVLVLALGQASALAVSPAVKPLVGVLAATEQALLTSDVDAKDRDGSWCYAENREALVEAMRDLRGRKRAWWLDAPRPLRAVVSRGPRHEVSVVALPSGAELPAASFPAGSLLVCQPLLGQLECRRVRVGAGGGTELELMRKVLQQGGAPTILGGGACHEWRGSPGVASAFLQVVLLPPTARLPGGECGGKFGGDAAGSGSIGWARPPDADGASDAGLVRGAALGAVELDDLLELERPSASTLALEAAGGGPPLADDAPALLRTLASNVGGLDAPLAVIVRRALASRLYPPALTRELGLSPVRGMLLYGPPGCGKTLLAREISGALGAREPKIVNGPEMMSKYVGDSESFIRALFADAELEQAEAGDGSALHVVVFDELDAFCRERGSLGGDTSGVRDSVVNQLLAKMDGVEVLDNLLVIGLTNRPELLDPALLRPGRLEVQVEVPRPDAAGRQQILGIHSSKLRAGGCLDARATAALSSGALAAATASFSGADLAGLLRSATSFALERYVDAALLEGWAPGAPRPEASGGAEAGGSAEAGSGLLEVGYDDFLRALREVGPSSAGHADPRGGARRLRGWWRESKLRARTERALLATK